jgi:hypothetical protein
MDSSLGLRMALGVGSITEADYIAALDYESPVPLFSSGAEAAAHGKAEVSDPGEGARRAITKLERRRERRQNGAKP